MSRTPIFLIRIIAIRKNGTLQFWCTLKTFKYLGNFEYSTVKLEFDSKKQ